MTSFQILTGSCSCGRNQFTIRVPDDGIEQAEIVLDRAAAGQSSISQNPPPIPYLRIPLPWYQSTTYAYFDDEAHRDIRKVYEEDGEKKRCFCGFCGEGLLWWEEGRSSVEWVFVGVGTLGRGGEEDEGGEGNEKSGGTYVLENVGDTDGEEVVTWYERLLDGLGLGGVKRSSGGGEGTARGSRVEWEIVEWIEEGGEQERVVAKRKIDVLEGGSDEVMDGIH